MTRLGLILLGTLAATLGGILGWQIAGSPERARVDLTPRPATVTARNLTPAVPANQIREWAASILARPLFEPSRRPPSVAEVSLPAQTIAPPPRVTGIVISSTGRSVIFAGGTTDKPIIATEGTRVGAYTVKSIVLGQVVVEGPSGLQTLQPSYDSRSRGAPSTAATLAPQAAPQQAGRFGLPPLPGLPTLPPQEGQPALPFGIQPGFQPGFQPIAPPQPPQSPGSGQRPDQSGAVTPLPRAVQEAAR